MAKSTTFTCGMSNQSFSSASSATNRSIDPLLCKSTSARTRRSVHSVVLIVQSRLHRTVHWPRTSRPTIGENQVKPGFAALRSARLIYRAYCFPFSVLLQSFQRNSAVNNGSIILEERSASTDLVEDTVGEDVDFIQYSIQFVNTDDKDNFL